MVIGGARLVGVVNIAMVGGDAKSKKDQSYLLPSQVQRYVEKVL